MIRRGLASATTVLTLLALATACGEDDDTGTGTSGDVETIEVSVEGDTVTPSGERVSVGVDQPVDLVITSDAAGELHIHTSPEQSYSFEAGENDPIELVFDRPGVVEVELHAPVESPVVELLVE